MAGADAATVASVGACDERSPDARSMTAFEYFAVQVISTLLGTTTLLADDRPVAVTSVRMHDGEVRECVPVASADLIDAHIVALLELTVPRSSEGELHRVLRPQANTREHAWQLPESTPDDYDFIFSLPPPLATGGRGSYAASVLAVYTELFELLDGSGRPVDPTHIGDAGAITPIPRRPPWELPELGLREEDQSGSQPLHSVVRSAPPIVALARHWSLIAPFVQAEPESTIDRMALRRPSDWLVPSDGHPAEVYQHLSRVCNVSCQFCYLFGNPTSLGVGRGRRVISSDELATRLKYFAPDAGTALFRAEWEINEELIDPKIFTVLPALRARTDRPFEFMTNGSPLNERVLTLLDEVAPVHLVVSVNSLDASIRHEVMRESQRNTRTALASLAALAEHRIPFGVSFVATQTVPLDLLAESILGVDRIGPAFIRINMPGYTRDAPGRPEGDLESHWVASVELISRLRHLVDTPLLTIPSAFEQNIVHDEPLLARVLGTVAGSPGRTAGIKPGDVVRQVGHHLIRDRAHLMTVLLLTRGTVPVLLERGGATVEVVLDTAATPTYPWPGQFIGKYMFPAGIAIAPCLSVRDVSNVVAIAEELNGREVWVATSRLMAPAAARALAETASPHADAVRLVQVRNRYLGGNIQVLDMATVGDIVMAVQPRLETSPRPALYSSLRPGSTSTAATSPARTGPSWAGGQGYRLGCSTPRPSSSIRRSFRCRIPRCVLVRPPVDVLGIYAKPVESLALAYLASASRARGHEVTLVDAMLLGLSVDETVDRILAARPDVVGITNVLNYVPGEIGAIGRRLREGGFTGAYLAGGHSTSFLADDTLRRMPDVDGVVIGEGEQSFPAVLTAVAYDDDWRCVPGVFTRGPAAQRAARRVGSQTSTHWHPQLGISLPPSSTAKVSSRSRLVAAAMRDAPSAACRGSSACIAGDISRLATGSAVPPLQWSPKSSTCIKRSASASCWSWMTSSSAVRTTAISAPWTSPVDSSPQGLRSSSRSRVERKALQTHCSRHWPARAWLTCSSASSRESKPISGDTARASAWLRTSAR